MDIKEVPAFPNPGVRLIKEDDHIAIFEEIFEPGKPTDTHRHTRDYVAFFPKAGEATVVAVAGDPEEVTLAVGEVKNLPVKTGGTRFGIEAGTVYHGHVPPDGTAHFAVNEGSDPLPMILVEIKGTGVEKAK